MARGKTKTPTVIMHPQFSITVSPLDVAVGDHTERISDIKKGITALQGLYAKLQVAHDLHVESKLAKSTDSGTTGPAEVVLDASNTLQEEYVEQL